MGNMSSSEGLPPMLSTVTAFCRAARQSTRPSLSRFCRAYKVHQSEKKFTLRRAWNSLLCSKSILVVKVWRLRSKPSNPLSLPVETVSWDAT